MTNPDIDCGNLSERLLLLRNTFRQAREGYLEFDHQRAKTFLALLDESYEDALLLEAAAFNRANRFSGVAKSSAVVVFPGKHVRPHLIEGGAPEGEPK